MVVLMNARAVAAVAIVGLAALLWWQTRPSSSAGRQGPASSGNGIAGSPVPPPLSPAGDRGGEVDGEESWQPTGYEAVDWQPGEEPIGWDRWLGDFVRPRPGEGLLEYRDRIVPAAQLAIAPQRQAVARSLERFAADAGLSEDQRAEVDAVIGRAEDALKERVRSAVWGGELFRPGVRPIDGVRFARDLLDRVLVADAELRATLTPGQVEVLDRSGFDVAFYLLVATRWEQLVGVE